MGILESVATKPFRASSYGIASRSRFRVAMGIDSLTNNGGTPTSNYRSTLSPLLKAKYGDGLLGLTGANDTCDGALAYDNVTGTDVSSLAWNHAIRVKSFFGKGRYWNNASGVTCNFRDLLGAASLATSATLWFEFTAAGQQVNISQYFGGAGTSIIVNSNNYPLNTPIPIIYPLAVNNSSYVGIALTINTNGANDLYFWAKEFHYPQSVAGVEAIDLGIGGAGIANWAGLTASRFAFWVGVLNPDYFIFNGGMNDRGSGLSNANPFVDKIPAAMEVTRNLYTVIGQIVSGAPKLRGGLIVSPNDSNDNAATCISYYAECFRAVAKSYNWGFFDDIALLGSYATAVANGDMTTGDVHPTPQGNAKRGNAYGAIMALV